MDIKRLVLATAFVFSLAPAYACVPLPPAAPAAKDAEPSVQPAAEQRLQEILKNHKDLAVVTVESETYQEKQPATAFAILKIRQGWGETKNQLLTYSRAESVCGPLQKLTKDGSYLAVLDDQHKVLEVFEYSLAKKHLKALGEPDYKYNKKGELKKSSGK